MADEAVELNVAGQSCRVVTSANPQELQELAGMVEDKLKGMTGPGRPLTTQTMLLAAVALANDVREQQARADAIAERAKVALRSLLKRVDGALEEDQRSQRGTANKKKKKSSRSRPHKPT
jgi:cell division protein ZapA